MTERDDAPGVEGEFGVDTDEFTEEDGVADDVDQPLPEIDVAQFPPEAS